MIRNFGVSLLVLHWHSLALLHSLVLRSSLVLHWHSTVIRDLRISSVEQQNGMFKIATGELFPVYEVCALSLLLQKSWHKLLTLQRMFDCYFLIRED